jgi:biotin synthase-related radical SAM superfamily protein
LFGIVCTGLGVAAFINQGCPACNKPIGELFWIVQYCPHCGTKLSED